MIDIFFLNRELERFINNTTINDKLKRFHIKELLIKEYPKRIRPDLKEKILNLFEEYPEDKEFISSIDFKFKPIEAEVGKTYALFINENVSQDYDSLAIILNISYDPKDSSNGPYFDNLSIKFKPNFEKCFDYVSRLIENNLKNAFFFRGVYRKLKVRLLNPFNELLTNTDKDIQLFGNSLEVPLAVAIFSVLIDEKIDPSIACSGKINEKLEIGYVEGMKEKILGAIKEYPEIKTFVFPEDCKNVFKDNIENIDVRYVKTLDEVLNIYFKNFKNIINEKPLKGKINILVDEVTLENDDKATKIELDFSYKEDEYISNDILPFLVDNVIHELIEENSKSKPKIFLLNNFRANWLVAALMPKFINKSEAVGIYNAPKAEYIIVYVAKSPKKFKIGDIVKLKAS